MENTTKRRMPSFRKLQTEKTDCKTGGKVIMKGATAWEYQWGRLYIRILMRKYWHPKNAVVKIYWLNKDGGFD